LALTVGTLGIGIMNSTAFSPLANRDPEVDEIQIPFGTIDFQPHQSNFTQAFKSMDEDMDLMIESLSFHPTKPGPSTSESKTVAMTESLEGSSCKVNSPVSFAEAEERKIAEGDETIEF
jgi:hypothetical protein